MLKKLFLMAAVLFGIFIIAAIVVPYFIPDNAFKRPILRKMQAMTGHKITVDGRIRIRLFPIAGVTMDNVTMSNPPRVGDATPLITLKSVDVDVAVLPLLGGNIEVKKLVIDEPHINLHVTKDGIKNWLPPQPQQAIQAAPPPAAMPAQAPPSAMAMPRDVVLSDVRVKDGTITYVDEAAAAQWEIKKLNVSLGLEGFSSPFTVDASSEWNGKPVTVKGTLSTFASFLNQERTQVDADIESELLSLKLNGFISTVIYNGTATVKSPSLKELLAWANPTGAPVQSPAKLALNLTGDMECAIFSCTMSNVNMKLDNIEAKGNVKITRGEKTGQPPRVDVVLTTGVLDFNPFMSQRADASDGAIFSDAYAEADGKWSEKSMDLSVLQAVNGTANITADGIVMNKITLGKTALRAQIDNGKLNAEVVDAVMYGGKGNITVNMDSVAATPTLAANTTLKGVQVQPLFKAAADMSRMSGTADIAFTVSSQGKSEKELIGALAGNGQFTLANGAIEGVDLVNIIAGRAGDVTGKTPITDMKGTFTIAQGTINNKDLVMTLPTLNIGGQGSVNLPAYSINYRLTPQVVQAAGQGGAAKQGVGIPVIVEGSLDKPSFRPDLKAVAQEALKNPEAFKDQLKTTRDSLKDQLKNPDTVKNLKNLLNGL